MRYRDWDARLFGFQQKVLGRAFVWGETDCASLVVSALEAMYPPDDLPIPLKSHRPTWTTKTGAVRVHNRTGGVEAFLREGGCEEVWLSYAQQGDVVTALDEQGGVPGAGVVVESHLLVASQEEGVVRRPLRGLRENDADVTVLRPPHG